MDLRPGMTANDHLHYLAGLDGLRALAVCAVLLYHAGLPWATGGFLGVDIFFVLSGYLITTLLLTEWQHSGRIDLGRFWFRRVMRLLPAVFVLLVAVTAFVTVVLPEEVSRLSGDVVASLASVMNWHLIFGQVSYFEAIGRPSPLQHLWSLAVEMHFYLLWPLLFRWVVRRHSHYAVMPVILTGIVISTATMVLLYEPGTDPSRVYYGTDTRAATPLVGAALACVWRPGRQRRSRILAIIGDVFGLVALGMLGWCFVGITEFSVELYRGGFLGVALLAAVAVAAAGVDSSWSARAFGWAPLAALGRRSYSIYLWHWPVIVYTRPGLDVPFDGVLLLLMRLVCIFVLAELSYRWVERPFRRWASAQANRDGHHHQLRGIAGTTIVLASVLVLMAHMAIPAAQAPASQVPEQVHAVVHADSTAWPDETASPSAELPAVVLSEATTAVISTPVVRSGQQAQVSPTPAPEDVSMSSLLAYVSATAIVISDVSVQLDAEPPSTPTTVPAVSPTPETSVTPIVAGIAVSPTLAIGDSVMLGSVRALAQTFGTIEVDARQSRQIKAFIAIVQARHAAGQLPETVIIHVGTNGPISKEQFDTLMNELRDVRRVVIVDVQVPRPWEQPNNQIITEGVTRYQNAVLVGWKAAVTASPDLVGRDGVHLTRKGAEVYASLLASAAMAP